ncbi:2'-5' RNA ligase family protein [Paenibacillus senegalensis]|uniref:2'-5' RNA ligase family protein n=1 Tax=Paenibacillus senegalensis TaxID=1465766 RepID=UPI0002D47F38|nr:2'-5' RNA ligase family protein [Paenibacillus senegalensis]
MMNYAVVIFPPKEIQDFANSYRKRYDPRYLLIPPHITIREKEEWDPGMLEKAVDHLNEAANQLTSFEAVFNRFSSFKPTNNVIYLAFKDNGPFERCREAICRDILEQNSKDQHFTPHLTVGQQLGDDEFHDVLASVRKTEVDLSFRVDRFHLVYQTDNEAWTVYQTFLLQN